MPYVKVERKGAVAKVVIDRRPDNALSSEVLEELKRELESLAVDKEVRVIVLTGAGENFSIGADVEELARAGPEKAVRLSKLGQEVIKLIRSVEKPVVAVVRGFVLGGALELATACDVVAAAEDAEFAASETGMGLIPGWGGTQLLARLVGERKARSIIVTGRALTAQQAREIGLVDVVVPIHLLEREVEEVIVFLLSRAPLAVAAAKRAISKAFEKPLSEGLELETKEFSALFATRDKEEGSRAFLEGREPKFKGE